ncbi:unnamed protein product [Gordionus sp. m RMFG-2023]|uniref:cyclin-dependent kinase 11B-like isoform X2 n=1 Tax=Gordionus sp. m RMFG-2023 TaxID=3053472 RepID=UPI0030E43565
MEQINEKSNEKNESFNNPDINVDKKNLKKLKRKKKSKHNDKDEIPLKENYTKHVKISNEAHNSGDEDNLDIKPPNLYNSMPTYREERGHNLFYKHYPPTTSAHLYSSGSSTHSSPVAINNRVAIIDNRSPSHKAYHRSSYKLASSDNTKDSLKNNQNLTIPTPQELSNTHNKSDKLEKTERKHKKHRHNREKYGQESMDKDRRKDKVSATIPQNKIDVQTTVSHKTETEMRQALLSREDKLYKRPAHFQTLDSKRASKTIQKEENKLYTLKESVDIRRRHPSHSDIEDDVELNENEFEENGYFRMIPSEEENERLTVLGNLLQETGEDNKDVDMIYENASEENKGLESYKLINDSLNDQKTISEPKKKDTKRLEENLYTESDYNIHPKKIKPINSVTYYYPAFQGCRSVEEYQCLNRIEEGTYGVVYRAKNKKTNEIVALKRLKMEKEKEGFPITSLREINTLMKAHHPNVVSILEIVVGSNMDKIYIVMEFVEHDLKSLMETMKQPFLIGETKTLLMQLLRGVHHLHDNWILHRDIKASNVLVSHGGSLKLGDFGLAREYGSPLKPYTPVVVTLWYRAPELLLGASRYSTHIDTWSVGCLFAELLTLEPAFRGKSEVDQLNKIYKDLGTPNETIWPGYTNLPMVKKINFVTYPYNNIRKRYKASLLSDIGFDLLNKFLTYDPTMRISADVALNHPFFNESPLPVNQALLPTFPAKSELSTLNIPHVAVTKHSPKPPSGGKLYDNLMKSEICDSDNGSSMTSAEYKLKAQILAGQYKSLGLPLPHLNSNLNINPLLASSTIPPLLPNRQFHQKLYIDPAKASAYLYKSMVTNNTSTSSTSISNQTISQTFDSFINNEIDIHSSKSKRNYRKNL